MVRLSISPGPLEGADVFDSRDRHLGVVEDIEVTGQHITSFRVALDEDIASRRKLTSSHISVARDWLASTDGERLDLALTLDELLREIKR